MMPFFLLHLFFWPFFVTPSLFARPLFLSVGERRLLPVAAHDRMYLAKNNILQVRDLGRHIELKALRKGQISVRVGALVYEVIVLPISSRGLTGRLEDEMLQIRGVQFQFQQNLFKVTGELWRFSDWRKISQWLDGLNYEFHAAMESSVEAEAKDYFYSVLRQRGLPLPSAPLRLPRAIAFGQTTDAQKSQLQEFFKKFGLIIVAGEGSGLSLQPLVRLRVLVAEINQAFSQELGLNWQSNYQAQVFPRPMDEGGLVAQLKSLETHGQGQVLASPNLVCRSGGEAQFMAGGEIPITLRSRHLLETTWKKHGVILQFKPEADASGHITLSLAVEVSVLDTAHMIEGIPGLKVNRIESQLNFMGSKTLVLSGLLRNNFGHSTDSLALMQEIPILGALFRSRNFMENRTELVVFVTPSIENFRGPLRGRPIAPALAVFGALA